MLSRIYLAIDSQNVSYRVFPQIINHINHNICSRITTGKVYMDLLNVDQGWVNQSIHYGLDPIGVYCHPGKDSVDHCIVSDLIGNNLIRNSKYDGIVLITNDSDFRKIALELKPYTDKTILYCLSRSPKDLVNCFDSVFYYDNIDSEADYNTRKSKKRKKID